jgi:serine/threonine-protein kinase
MTGRAPCPDAGWWSDLLEGRLSAKEQAGLNSHLEGCADCQQVLERLTAGDASWLENAGSPMPAAPALRRVMEDLKGVAGQTTVPAATTPAGTPALPFLLPPAQPGHLGRLGAYEVIEVIGQGGMGVVLKARDPALQRLVAIKVLAPQLATSAPARLRFQREGRATAAVHHDHVVAIHAVEEVDGLPYLVMEYVRGVSLQQQLDCFGPPEVEEILRIGMETAAGLTAAHAQGLIHRDVKPANILLEDGVGRVKLSDFGLARAVDDASLTQSGVIAGTPQYMAPEQARGEAVDHRADLFSLGSVLYALCTGRPPFRAPTTLAVLRSVCEDTPQPIREQNAAIPDFLVEIIDALHAKDPADRFQAADEVSWLLDQHLRHLRQPTVVAPPPRLPRRRRRARPRRPRRRALLLVLLLVLLLPLGALVALGAWFYFGPKNQPGTGPGVPTVFRPPSDDELPVALANGRVARRGIQCSLQVDYRLTHGTLPAGEGYVWIVQSPTGLILSQPLNRVEIAERGTLQASQFIPAPILMDGNLKTYLALDPSGPQHGQLQRISNIVPLR